MNLFTKISIILTLLILLIVSRLVISFVPFKRISDWMSSKKQSQFPDIGIDQEKRIYFVSKCLRILSKYVPFRFNCFTKSLAGKFYLNRKNIPATIFFGVKKEQGDDKLKAHAWLKSNDIFVSGHSGHDLFTVIKIYT